MRNSGENDLTMSVSGRQWCSRGRQTAKTPLAHSPSRRGVRRLQTPNLACHSPVSSDITRADVRLRLLAEEHSTMVNDQAARLDAGPSAFIVLGLDIRTTQYVRSQLLWHTIVQLTHHCRLNLALLRKETEASDSSMQRINLQNRLAALLGKIRKFVQLQAVYMPRLHDTAAPPRALTLLDIDSFSIILPSDVPSDQRVAVCGQHTQLPRVEDELQYADACDALESVRHSLRMRTCYNQDKVANVTGQVRNTKARTLQASVDQAVKNAAARYRGARLAIERLRGPGPWQESLRPLLDSDLVGLNERAMTREEAAERERVRALGDSSDGEVEESDAAGVPLEGNVYVGEGRRTLSWIWYSGESGHAEGGDDFGLSEGSSSAIFVRCHYVHADNLPHLLALRVEWAKVRARAARWHEQVRLVYEEMRRVIAATQYRARHWNLLRSRRQTQIMAPSLLLEEELDEGLVAYADEHVFMETRLADAFEAKWAVIQQKAREYLARTTPNRPAATADTPVDAASEVEGGTTEVVHVEIDVASEVESGAEDE